MLIKQKAVTATPTNLNDLLGEALSRSTGIALQAPVANAAVVNFGNSASQPAFILAGGSTGIMPITTLTDLYIKGTVGDNVIVLIF